MLFQALGSQYTYVKALRHLFTIGHKNDAESLIEYLSEHYGGRVVLYHRGRTALSEAIKIATGGKGKVAISGFTCYSVPQAVEAAGCAPVYIDIDKNNLNFNAHTLEKAIKENSDIRCIIVQNTIGITCDIVAIRKITDRYNLVLIEDLAHSLGAHYVDGSETGTVGDIVMLSFGRDKAVDVGSGGAIIVRKDKLIDKLGHSATRIRRLDSFRDKIYPILMWHVRKFYIIGIGKLLLFASYKLKLAVRSADGGVNPLEGMPCWQAKKALVEIRSLSRCQAMRVSNARIYLSKLPSNIVLLNTLNNGSVPLRLPIIVGNRAEYLAEFSRSGIFLEDTWYDRPVAPARFYGRVNYPEKDCPTAVEIAKNIINLPVHESVSEDYIHKIIEIIQRLSR